MTQKDENPVLPFEGTIKGYTINFLRENEWKLDGFLEFDDLMQEAWAVYLLVAQRYSHVVKNQKHFMALYKSALRNKIIDLAAKATDCRRHVTTTSSEEDAQTSILEMVEGDLENEGYLSELIRTASSEVKAVLTFVFQPEKNEEQSLEFWKNQERNWRGWTPAGFVEALEADADAEIVRTDAEVIKDCQKTCESVEEVQEVLGLGKKKFLGNEYLCRCLGYDHNIVDLVQMTHDHLRDASV